MNKIERLERADGSKCTDVEEDRAEVQAFYQALYTSRGFQQMDELLDFVPNRVTDTVQYQHSCWRINKRELNYVFVDLRRVHYKVYTEGAFVKI